jgi:hypothetical protein
MFDNLIDSKERGLPHPPTAGAPSQREPKGSVLANHRPPPGGGWHAKRDWGRVRALKYSVLKVEYEVIEHVYSIFIIHSSPDSTQRKDYL